MKSKLRAFALLIATIGLFSASAASKYEIQGKISKDNGLVYLKGFRNKMFYTIDSAKIIKGTFRFMGSVQQPDLFGLTTDRNESFSPCYIFIENSTMQVSIETKGRETAKISGSASNDLFLKFHNREDYRIDSLIKANPRSTVVAYLLYREIAPELSASQIEENLTLFDPSLTNLSYIKELKDIVAIRKKVELGNRALDFSSTTPQGNVIKLSDYFGNYLLLDFWASWCGPCRMENPRVVKAFEKYKSKGFSVFAVSLDKNREDWVKAIEKDGLTWPQVSDLKFWDCAPARLYGIRSIPSNVLLDPSGKIIARNLRGDDLEKKLAELYGF